MARPAWVVPVKPERIGIVGALRWEIRGVLKQLDSRRRLPVNALCLWEGDLGSRAVVVAQCGIGRVHAERALSVLVDRFHLSALLCIGFCGATCKTYRPGDIVLCSAVHSGEEIAARAEWERGESIESDKELIQLGADVLRSAGIPFHVAVGLTVPRVIHDPDTKAYLGETLKVNVLDMESYWIARRARGRAGRVLMARAVSDAVSQSIPGLTQALGVRPQVGFGDTALELLRLPRQAAAFLHLARGARKAARNLGAFVPAFVRRL